MHRLLLPLFLILAACATPRAQCEAKATRDLRTLDALIVETEQNIERGYALDREVTERPRLTFCYGRRIDGARVGMTFCNDTEVTVRDRPVAIDLRAERAKLASLREKRAEVARRTARALSACAARYPDPQ